jgi:hypothetical protein
MNEFEKFYGVPAPDQIKPAPGQPKLIPLIERSSNEAVANTLARLLIDDENQVESGSMTALLILTGIQAYLDSGGDYLAVEILWEPVIVAKQIMKAYGNGALDKATEMAVAARALNDVRGAQIYERVVALLSVDKVAVDSPS